MSDEPRYAQEDCGTCHGQGVLACINGCHTTKCDTCEGSGRVDESGFPIPENEVEH